MARTLGDLKIGILSLSVATARSAERRKAPRNRPGQGMALNVIGVPKTTDNDIFCSEDFWFRDRGRRSTTQCYWLGTAYSVGLRYPLRLRMRRPFWFGA